MNKPIFPVPRITESFIDSVFYEMKWHRYTDKYSVVEGQLNADYLSTTEVAELKIFEEEGLLKKEHQNKVSTLFEHSSEKAIDLEIENIPEEIRKDFEDQIARPFQNAIKKASKQMRQSSAVSGNSGARIIVAVNNGFSYLNADNFERIFVSRCKRDSKSIDFAACVTVSYHQGDFDSFIFCTTRVHAINSKSSWSSENEFVQTVSKKFGNAMSIMIRDQMNPEIWATNLDPVSDICFKKNEVEYLRKAPYVPDSRFK